MSGFKKFNLIYKNKESGEVKKFSRDEKRNYMSEDGTEMSKSDSYTKWSFIGKDTENGTIRFNDSKKSAGKSVFDRAKAHLNAMLYAMEVSNNQELEKYISGFVDCLNILEGRD